MTDLVSVLALGGALAGAIVAIVQATITTRQARAAVAEVRRLEQGEELEVLKSNDMKRLGRYLYENIGSTRISSYVSNKEVRDKVSRALDGVLGFLGTEETKISPEESAEATQEVHDFETAQAREGESIQVLVESEEEEEEEELSEMQQALQQITFGEVWNGLARMRRYIEGELKAIASDRPKWQELPLGRLLTVLKRENYISDRVEKLLRYAINVANAGIHGSDIEVGQAQEAWEAAVRGLATLSMQRPGTGRGEPPS